VKIPGTAMTVMRKDEASGEERVWENGGKGTYSAEENKDAGIKGVD